MARTSNQDCCEASAIDIGIIVEHTGSGDRQGGVLGGSVAVVVGDWYDVAAVEQHQHAAGVNVRSDDVELAIAAEVTYRY